jgi:hypothetical protein
MWWVTFYFCTFFAAVAAWAGVRLGWRPPFVQIWDIRAVLYVGFICLLIGWLSAIGLAVLVPRSRLPRFLRAIPAFIALLLPACLFYALIGVSPQSSQSEIASKVGIAIGMGIGIGSVVGLLAGLSSDSTNDTPSSEEIAKAPLRLALMLLVVVVGGIALLLFPRERDDPKLTDYGSFSGPQGRLELAIVSGPFGQRFGVVRITNQGNNNLLVLEADEWDRFEALLTQVERPRSDQRRNVGEIHDTELSDPTRLQLSSGAGLRFVMTSAHGPTVSYDLPASDVARCNAAVAKVAAAEPKLTS